MFVAERHLRPKRKVRESGVVNSSRKRTFPAAPVGAGIQSQSKPAIKIIGNAGAGAARIRFQVGPREREGCSWKLAVYIRVGIKVGVSAVKLPLGGRLVLSCGE